jgi:hypothetical protein
MKEKLETLKTSEKTLLEEKTSASEKLKALKLESSRKDTTIKDLKDRLEEKKVAVSTQN